MPILDIYILIKIQTPHEAALSCPGYLPGHHLSDFSPQADFFLELHMEVVGTRHTHILLSPRVFTVCCAVAGPSHVPLIAS